jgi:hypothetical protein
MSRVLQVEGDRKTFRITIPDDAKVTFGPFSPPVGDEAKGYGLQPQKAKGTLRIYQGGKTKATESVLAVFVGVASFRDLSVIEYEEQVVVEKGATI